MALIVIRTCSTTTLGVEETFRSILGQLVQQWGDVPEVYFDLTLIPEGSMFRTDEDMTFFRKRHEEIALATRGGVPILKRKDHTEVPGERIANSFDERMAVTAANLHIKAIHQLIAILPPERGEEIVKNLEETFGYSAPSE